MSDPETQHDDAGDDGTNDDDQLGAAAAKEEASKHATDPATWRAGGVRTDP